MKNSEQQRIFQASLSLLSLPAEELIQIVKKLWGAFIRGAIINKIYEEILGKTSLSQL